MAALAADTPRKLATFPKIVAEGLVAASTKIYEGAALTHASGYVSNAAGDGVEDFLGIALEHKDNSSGSAGDLKIKYAAVGIMEIAVTGASITTICDAVYISDNATYTLTSTSNTRVGNVLQHVTGTTCLVYFFGESDVLIDQSDLQSIRSYLVVDVQIFLGLLVVDDAIVRSVRK